MFSSFFRLKSPFFGVYSSFLHRQMVSSRFSFNNWIVIFKCMFIVFYIEKWPPRSDLRMPEWIIFSGHKIWPSPGLMVSNKMNSPPLCYSYGSRTTKVEKECCKMRKLAADVSQNFKNWQGEMSLAYQGVLSVLGKRFTCDKNGKFPCKKGPLIEDLLSVVDIRHAQIIADLIKDYK